MRLTSKQLCGILTQDLPFLSTCEQRPTLVAKLDFREVGFRGNKPNKSVKSLAVSLPGCFLYGPKSR